MKQPARPLIFGEVLFDVFNDRNEVLGGAPFNVAWHLAGFGYNPLLISRTGKDERAEKIKKHMQQWKMTTSGIQSDPHHPTGVVKVNTTEGIPEFQIEDRQAYDYINFDEAVSIVRGISWNLFYHGTLALRNPVSRTTQLNLARATGAPVFVDVNLRKPWWNEEILLDALSHARWVKCNRDELDVLAGLQNIHEKDLRKKSESIANHFNLEYLVVTLGADGAQITDQNAGTFLAAAPQVNHFVDTVGAGDAFSAVVIIGIVEHWSAESILNRALQFASKICSIRGATLNDQDYYASLKKGWENQNVSQREK